MATSWRGRSHDPEVVDQFAAHVLWMAEEPMLPGRSYLLRIGTKYVPARITTLKHKIDVNNLDHIAARTLALNEIGLCNISTSTPVAFDPYEENRETGAFILIDRYTNATAGAGMITFGLRRATNIHRQSLLIDKGARTRLHGHQATILWFTGLPGSGKSTIANIVERELHAQGAHTYLLDGDNVRHGLSRDLGFTDADRVENIRRVGEVAKLFVDAGMIVLCSFISPSVRSAAWCVSSWARANSSRYTLIQHSMSASGAIRRVCMHVRKPVTSRTSPGSIRLYEPPEAAEVVIRTDQHSAEEAARRVIDELQARHLI